MTQPQNNSKRSYLLLLVIAIITVIVLANLMTPNDGSDSRLENAAEEVGDGIEDAGRDLDPNRTTGEKVGDAIEDAGESISDSAE